MRRKLALPAIAIALCGFMAPRPDPPRAQIVTSDVEHFWRAFDDASKRPQSERVEVYRKEYLDAASQGLKDFIAFRRITPESFAAHVEENRDYYMKVRRYIGQVVGQKPIIEAAFRRFTAIYPGVRFPHVYFVVGPQRGAGMNSPNGIILAAEMFATPPGTPYSYTKVSPDYVAFSAVHETVHFNQAYETTDKSTLLQQVLNEGAADFVASLVLQEPDVRQMTDRWAYGCPHEESLYTRFANEEDRIETSPWFFNHDPANGWPPDMGYWLGYRISQAFYARASDKHAALRELLEVKDFKALLEASGYPQTRTACVPETAISFPGGAPK